MWKFVCSCGKSFEVEAGKRHEALEAVSSRGWKPGWKGKGQQARCPDCVKAGKTKGEKEN